MGRSRATPRIPGDGRNSYLATSPGGTATSFGANLILIDDIIKNVEDAYNELVLDKHWEWFTNTMMQRTEGDDWKVIGIMTRWATNDLAGRILAAHDDVEHITYTAVQPDGSMLCDDILNRRDYDLKTQEMNPDIIEANYNQKPIDIEGRLFGAFTEYDSLPDRQLKKLNYTDTADKGTDFVCSVNYVEDGTDVYVTDVYMSDAGMEETEPAVAAMLAAGEVDQAEVESNNGGRGFARNIERELKEKHANRRCVVKWKAQTANKEARILASSSWVNRHVLMPRNWAVGTRRSITSSCATCGRVRTRTTTRRTCWRQSMNGWLYRDHSSECGARDFGHSPDFGDSLLAASWCRMCQERAVFACVEDETLLSIQVVALGHGRS